MPESCCRADYDTIFDDRTARRELADYRRKGAAGTTARLIDAVRALGAEGAEVLDIGGGVGVVGTELLLAGAARLTDVDASHPYLAAARLEVDRRGFGERATFRYGDFVEVASEIAPADIVTLDRVICCYGDWTALVDRSVERARRTYGVVFPVERWWVRAVVGAGNLGLRLFRKRFKFHVHPERTLDARIRAAGFERRFHHRGVIWQTAVYARTRPIA